MSSVELGNVDFEKYCVSEELEFQKLVSALISSVRERLSCDIWLQTTAESKA